MLAPAPIKAHQQPSTNSSPSPQWANHPTPVSLPHHPAFQEPSIPPDPYSRHRIPRSNENEHTNPPYQQHYVPPARLPSESSFGSSTPSLVNESYDEDATPLSARTTTSSLWTDNSPRLANILLPGTDLNAVPPDYTEYQPEQSVVKYMPNESFNLQDLYSHESHSSEEEEEIVRRQDPDHSWLISLGSPTASEASSPPGGIWNNAFGATIPGQPRLHYDSEEMLLMRFDKQTCGILSVKDGPNENPWRMMLWPLAREESSGALRHAITALTAFHASKDNSRLRIKGMEHMTQSLQLLSHRMSSMELTASLATTLVLAFCESWDVSISTGIKHLNGARQLVGQIYHNYCHGMVSPENEPQLGFLCRTWVYMDVIARLTSFECDDSQDFDILSTPLCQPSTIKYDVDPLMGCATTLFPIIGRVANLIRRVRERVQPNSLQIIAQARELKSRLEKWAPPALFETPEDQSTEVEQGLRTAEAYRGATLLYLLQAVPEISYDCVKETIAELAQAVLTNIANVPVSSGVVIVHIFPLLAASCESVDCESRTFVKERWQAMMRRMKIQNLDRCLDVVKEVWDRRDNAEMERQRRKTREAVSMCRTGYIPATIMKRKFSNGENVVSEPSVDGKRRAIQSTMNSCSSSLKPGHRRRESMGSAGSLEPELTVRGRQHWAGVMKDLQWEGECMYSRDLSKS